MSFIIERCLIGKCLLDFLCVFAIKIFDFLCGATTTGSVRAVVKRIVFVFYLFLHRLSEGFWVYQRIVFWDRIRRLMIISLCFCDDWRRLGDLLLHCLNLKILITFVIFSFYFIKNGGQAWLHGQVNIVCWFRTLKETLGMSSQFYGSLI